MSFSLFSPSLPLPFYSLNFPDIEEDEVRSDDPTLAKRGILASMSFSLSSIVFLPLGREDEKKNVTQKMSGKIREVDYTFLYSWIYVYHNYNLDFNFPFLHNFQNIVQVTFQKQQSQDNNRAIRIIFLLLL